VDYAAENRMRSWRDTERPWPAEMAVQALNEVAGMMQEQGNGIDQTDGIWGATIGILEGFGDRHTFMRAVFDAGSTKNLSPWQRASIVAWVKPHKDEITGKWSADQSRERWIKQEFTVIVQRELMAEGQMPLTADRAGA